MTRLVVATYNMHRRVVENRPAEVRADLDFIMSHAHVAGLQEAGHGDRLMRNIPYPIYNGPNEASESTPILWKRGIRPVRKRSVFLTPPTETYEYRAAGGSRIKEKWLNSITFYFGGRWITFGTIHTTPSIWAPRHDRLNEIQVYKTAEWMGNRRSLPIVSGDWNQEPGASNLNVMARNDLASMQKRFGPVPTLENRAIDDIYFRPGTGKLRPVKMWRKNGISDHHMVFAEFEVLK